MSSAVGLFSASNRYADRVPQLSTTAALEQSHAYCREITRLQARNFYYGLRLLPEPKRSAMFALYAYMRLADDIADADDGRGVQQRIEDLRAWGQCTRDVLAGACPADTRHDAENSPGRFRHHPVWPAVLQMVERHHVPGYVFDEAIAGQQQDLHHDGFADFEQLRTYCHRVAGVVGLASIYVWGFSGGEETEQLAMDRGVAFQLTNILRDLREDASLGRSYVPRNELLELGLTASDLREDVAGENRAVAELLDRQIERAHAFYERSSALEQRIAPDSRPTLTAMTAIYRGLLHKIERHPRQVLSRRVSLSMFTKLHIAWKASRAR